MRGGCGGAEGGLMAVGTREVARMDEQGEAHEGVPIGCCLHVPYAPSRTTSGRCPWPWRGGAGRAKWCALSPTGGLVAGAVGGTAVEAGLPVSSMAPAEKSKVLTGLLWFLLGRDISHTTDRQLLK